jgi:hypothetical protein
MGESRAVTFSAGLVAIAAAVALMLSGVLHPDAGDADSHREAYLTMASGSNWDLSHWMLLLGFLLISVTLALFMEVPHLAERRMLMAASRVAMLAALFMTIHAIPHLLVASEVEQLANGGQAPLYEFTRWTEAVGLPFFGLSLAAVALAGMRGCALSRNWVAILGAIGALVFGTAGLLTAGFAIGAADVLFPLSALISFWLSWSGIGLIRAAVVGAAQCAVPTKTVRREPADAVTA